MASDNLTEEIEELGNMQQDIVQALAPYREDGKIKYPEMSVSDVGRAIGKSRQYTSPYVNQLADDNILVKKDEGAKSLCKLNEQKQIGELAFRLKRRRDDIEALQSFAAEEVVPDTIPDSESPFAVRLLNLYATNAKHETGTYPLQTINVNESKLQKLLEREEQVTVRHLVVLISDTIKNYYEDIWKEELYDRFDNLLQQFVESDSHDINFETKENVVSILWEHQKFKAKTKINPANPDHEIEFDTSIVFDDAWDMVSGFSDPENFQELSQIEDSRDFVNKLAEECRKVREYTITISERLTT